jgi:hypothetical protein
VTGLCAICAESRPTRSVRIDGRAFDVCVPCDTESPRLGRYNAGNVGRHFDNRRNFNKQLAPGCTRRGVR